jgi:glutamate carboxypeptidase
MSLHELVDDLKARREDMLATLASLVEFESPSHDKAALDGLAHLLAARMRAHGASVETIPTPMAGDHLRVRFELGAKDSQAPHGLVLCHFDTVWPIGTLATMPFRIDDGRAYGPGTFDMKTSLVLLENAVGAIRARGLVPPRPIVALLTSDEEVGSQTSRALIEEEAKRAAYVLVLEAPLPGGRLKTARKGVSAFTLTVEGKAAHAGVEPEKGTNAIVELAHQVLNIQKIADTERGTTLNVGVISGGTTTNVVPASAEARIDGRVTILAEAERVEAAMQALRPVLPGARLQVSGRFKRPPMERTAGVAGLYERVRVIGQELGLDLGEGSTGGASDGNFTAALGVPTIDGLGALGAGAHATHEHVLIDSLPERAALLAALLLRL